MKQTCILVLGMHRSGTSALTGLLSLLDVYLADTTRGDENNKKGYFENSKVQQLNDKIFSKIDSSWDDVFFNLHKLGNFIYDTSEIKNIIKNDFEYSHLFAIKDPRICLLFNLWERALQESNIDIKIILPYRNPIEVANSLNKRDGMPLEKGMLLWAYHFLLAEKFSRGYDRVFVEFNELMSSTSTVLNDLSTKLQINFLDKFNKNKKDIEEFLEPSLKHHNISMDNLSDNTPKIVKDILALKDSFNDSNLGKEFDALRYELFSYQKLFYNESIVSSLDEGQRVKQNLQSKDQELNETKQNLQSKEQELNQTKQSLQSKEQELNQTKQSLQSKEQELNQTKQNLQSKDQELNETKQNLQSKDQELNETKQNLQSKEQELNETKQNLQSKEQELNQTKQNLQSKEQELNQTKQNLQSKEQELNETKQNLQSKEQELNQTKQNLQSKEQELNETKQNLQSKEQELNQTKQNLQSKEQELNQTKQSLQSKEQELNQTKQSLQSKEQELNQTKQNLQSKEQELNQTKQELENIKIELANIYISKSWKLTRPLRRFMRIIKK